MMHVENNNEFVRKRKVAIMGYPHVGKTSIMNRLMFGTYTVTHNPTIWDAYAKEFQLDGRRFFVEMTDTQGLESFSLFPSTVRLTDGYILVYSIDDRASFEVLPTIYKLICEHDKMELPIILVGNKMDLNDYRQVSFEEGRKLAKAWNVGFIETSAEEQSDQSKILTRLLQSIEEFKGNIHPKKGKKKSKCCIH